MSYKNEVQISKALSAVLRHNKMGFKVDSSMFFIIFKLNFIINNFSILLIFKMKTKFLFYTMLLLLS